MTYIIRPIEIKDNAAVKALIIDTLKEFGCVGPGYACNDPELDDMFSFYQQAGGKFFVIEEDSTGAILGTGGFSRLKGTTVQEAVCELQKLYFCPALRGKGMGKRLVLRLMDEAKQVGFQEMYLETIPAMQTAIALYEKLGFQYLTAHRGATGHHQRCPIRMLKILQDNSLSDVVLCGSAHTSSR